MQSVEQAIVRVRTIYEQVAGRPLPEQGSEPYARIPPEADPQEHVTARAKELFGLVEELARGGAAPVPAPSVETVAVQPIPGVIVQSEAELRLLLDVPGISRAALEVVLEGASIVVRGTRAPVSIAPGEHLLSCDAIAGRLERSFVLPVAPAAGDVSAVLSDGVLAIRVKLQPGASRRQKIEIR